VTKRGQAKVLDFGLAKVMTARAQDAVAEVTEATELTTAGSCGPQKLQAGNSEWDVTLLRYSPPVLLGRTAALNGADSKWVRAAQRFDEGQVSLGAGFGGRDAGGNCHLWNGCVLGQQAAEEARNPCGPRAFRSSTTVGRPATTVDENVQRCRTGRALNKSHSRKIVQEQLLSEISAEDHGCNWIEIWQEGNNRDHNCVIRGRELDEANKPTDAKDRTAGSERPLKVTSTTAD
jgi:hypothetical protein